MKFRCDECGQRYAISDEKVRGKVLKIRCRKCNHVIVVREPVKKAAPKAADRPDKTRMIPAGTLHEALKNARPDSDGDDERTTMMSFEEIEKQRRATKGGAAPEPPPADDEDIEWYAVVSGKQEGPWTEAQLEAQVKKGRVTERTYVWCDRMDEWLPASDVEDLEAMLAAAAPPPPPKPRKRAKKKADNGVKAGAVEKASPPAAKAKPKPAPEPEAELEDVPIDMGDDDDLPDPEVEADAQANLEALFEDLPPPSQPEIPVDAIDKAIADDPFSQVPDAPGHADEAPRENTQMFILASGVNKRKSPLRIALFVLAFVGVIGGMGALLVYAGNGIDIGMIHIHAPGHHAVTDTGSSDSAASKKLREQLLGQLGGPKKAAAKTGLGADGAIVKKEQPKPAKLDASQKAALAALYGDKSRGALAIKIKDNKGKTQAVDSTKSPIDPKIIAKKIGASQRAFQGCVQQELHRDPSFKGGRVTLTLTVAPSGVVTHAALDNRSIASTDAGTCIEQASRRIVFPNFAGDDSVDFQIPLVLSTGY